MENFGRVIIATLLVIDDLLDVDDEPSHLASERLARKLML